jgi:hypothetical protein
MATSPKIVVIPVEEFKAKWPDVVKQTTDYIEQYLSEDGEQTPEQVHDEMKKFGGDNWRSKVFGEMKFGEVDGKPFSYWDDPFAPYSAGYDGVVLYDENEQQVSLQDDDLAEKVYKTIFK